MISDFLADHSWFSVAALAALVALAPVAGRVLARRHRLTKVFLGLSLVPVAVLTLLPVDRELFERCVVQWSLPTPQRAELMGNVVLFVAPVFLVAVLIRHPLLALLAGSGLSLGLEAVQALAPAIGRSCDTNDWLANTIGAGIGAALAALAGASRARGTTAA